ncbi:hypothetical protein CEXT_630161, partial [Caerostris extrusa]
MHSSEDQSSTSTGEQKRIASKYNFIKAKKYWTGSFQQEFT